MRTIEIVVLVLCFILASSMFVIYLQVTERQAFEDCAIKYSPETCSIELRGKP